MRFKCDCLTSFPISAAAGCKAIWYTVDCAILGRRINEAKNNFALPADLDLPNLPADLDWKDVTNDDSRLDYDDALTWESLIPWAKANTKLEIWLKGSEWSPLLFWPLVTCH